MSQGLTDDQTSEMLRLMRGADSVELKLTIPHTDRHSAMEALDIDPLEAQIRQVFFFDTPDLQLDGQGVVVRARRVQAVGDDSVVKLRPVVPDELDARLRAHPDFKVEVDAMPGGFVCSASFKAKLAEPHVRAATAGTKPVRKLFTKEQRAFLADHTGGAVVDDLVVLGPINVFKLKFRPKDYDRKFVAELWNYPDGERIVELSTKCLPTEAMQVAAECRVFLHDRGVDLTGEQQTKTRTALEFFAKELHGA